MCGFLAGIFAIAGQAKAYTLTVPTHNILNDPGTYQCNQNAAVNDSIAEDRTFYITNAWIGGNAHWDDYITYGGLFNGAVTVTGNKGTANCSSSATSGSGYVGHYE